ncbi:hypothetical protein [Kordiimonas pumila]|uniref:Nucleotide-diphospho-sugar transferase domain-containing protein n=1 Tax=Kordiimonas pumila TaxID=2161677 RepID=A0ABV7D6X5_9PROT|nr:hypothetical protein [Kordiimonas pumila]
MQSKALVQSPQVLDFQVLCAFYLARDSHSDTRDSIADDFTKTYAHCLSCCEFTVSSARETAYSAIYASIKNEQEQAIRLCAEARAGNETYCTPMAAVNLFYDHITAIRPSNAVAPKIDFHMHHTGRKCIVVACDKNYYDLYFNSFCKLSALEDLILHVHCINFQPDVNALEEKYGIRINLSVEDFSVSRAGDSFVTWCAASRFRVLPHILKFFDICVVSDIDGYIKPTLHPLLQCNAPAVYANVADTQSVDDIRLPWNSYYAGNLIIHKSEAVMGYAKTVAELCEHTLLNKIIRQDEKVYYFDQCALASATLISPCPVIPIPMFFHQNEPDSSQFQKVRKTII